MHVLSFLTRLVIPHHCVLCKTTLRLKEQSICQICVCSQARCTKFDVLPHQRIFDTVGASFQSVLINTESTSHLCKNLKYGFNYRLGISLGKSLLGPYLQSFCERVNKNPVLIPVPVSRKRKKMRGYNQSEKLSQGCLQFILAQGFHAAIVNLLQKVQHKRSQVEYGTFTRWTNPTGSMEVRKKIKQRIPENALLVLIDDTVTTGATLIHASEIVREHFPNHSILILTLALEV